MACERIHVICFGNELHGDDGFGPAVHARLAAAPVPEHVRLLHEVGATRALRHPNHLFDELAPAVAHARSHIARATAG